MGTIKKDGEKEQEEEEEAGGGEKEEEGRIPGEECHSILYSQVPLGFVTQLQHTVGVLQEAEHRFLGDLSELSTQL